MITVIKNTYPVFENGICTIQTNLLIKYGIIADTNCKDIPKNAYVIDADGGYTLAGFVDLHVHGGGNADFMDGNIDAFKTVTETHIKHGTTSLFPTSMTATEKADRICRLFYSLFICSSLLGFSFKTKLCGKYSLT